MVQRLTGRQEDAQLPPPPVPILTVEDRVNRLAPLMGSAGLKDTIPVVGQWI